jgi:hypothetical protein
VWYAWYQKVKTGSFTYMPRKIKKRMGRPPIGSKPFMVRVPPAQLAILEEWINRQEPRPTHPEAIRRLMVKALSCPKEQAI